MQVLRDSSPSVRQALTTCHIKTVASLMTCDVVRVAKQSGANKDEISAVQKAIVRQYSCFPVSGCDLLNDVMSSFFILSTGCDHWDELLDGGLYSGEVTEIVGSAGSGKTQICMSIATYVALNLEKNVLYVDTQGSFSSERIKEMVGSRDSSLTEQDIANILSRIRCVHAFDVFGVLDCLSDTRDGLYKEDSVFYNDLRLIIVDSVAFVITPILGGQQISGHSMMVHLARSLKSLAVQNGLAVMVTNNVVSDSTATNPDRVKPSLGQTWSHVPNTRVYLQKGVWPAGNARGQAVERIATVTKSSRQPVQISTMFFIQTAGVQDTRTAHTNQQPSTPVHNNKDISN